MIEKIKQYWQSFLIGLAVVLGFLAYLFFGFYKKQKSKTEAANAERDVAKEQGKIEESTKMVEFTKTIVDEQSKKVEEVSKDTQVEKDKLVKLEAEYEKEKEKKSESEDYFNRRYGSDS